jgi:D-alanine-D-alanine ligase
VLGTGPSASVLGVRGVTPRHLDAARFVYSLDRKRDGDYVVFDDLSRHPRALIEEVHQSALDAYRALGCRDVGRVDVRVNAAGKPAFLELNALPGIAPGWSDLPLIAEKVGLDYDALIAKVLEHARARYGL